MQSDPILLLDYTRWANQRVIAGLRQLPAGQLTAPIREGWLSPLEVLRHMVAAERVWLSRWLGHSPDRLPTRDDLPGLEDVIAAGESLRAETLAFIRSDDNFDRIVTYRTTAGVEHRAPLWQLILHLINHHTEHRSQVALVLAMHGIDVGNLDLIAYLRER